MFLLPAGNELASKNSALSNINGNLLLSGLAVDNISVGNFNKDFLGVNLQNKYADLNKRSYFVVHENDVGWLSYPPTMPTGTTVIGMREVFHYDNTHTMLRITEFYPLVGRQYFNFYNTDHWEGWKTITPA